MSGSKKGVAEVGHSFSSVRSVQLPGPGAWWRL